MGLPWSVGMDIYEPGQKQWILDMEAGKRLALDRLIHLAIPLVASNNRLALPISGKKQSSVLRLPNWKTEVGSVHMSPFCELEKDKRQHRIE